MGFKYFKFICKNDAKRLKTTYFKLFLLFDKD